MAQPFWIRVVFAAAAVAFPVILPAQTCFGGKASPTCHTFVVAEAGYGRAVTKVDPGRSSPGLFPPPRHPILHPAILADRNRVGHGQARFPLL